MKSEKLGKSYEMLYGKEKADKIKEKKKSSMIGKNKNKMIKLWKNKEYKEHMINVHNGKKSSKETKKKMSIAQLGRKHTEETKIKMRKPKSKIHSQNISKGILNYYNQEGFSKYPYSNDWTSTLKRAIRERDNYICQVCSNYGSMIHHIDYNKENCSNENLICVCNSCHSKTNHKRKVWINYFKKLKKLKW